MSDDLEHPTSDSTHRPSVAASVPRDTHAHRHADPDAPAPQPVGTDEFIVFYKQSVSRLVAFLRWHGASLPDAAECAQETLTQAMQHWSTIHHPRAWCRRVASRLYARRVASLEEPVEDAEAAGSPLIAPGTDLDALEQRHSVLRLIDQLPPRQRQVMAWTYDGATPSEIATELQITPDAVRSNLKKARATLRNHVHENGGEIG